MSRRAYLPEISAENMRALMGTLRRGLPRVYHEYIPGDNRFGAAAMAALLAHIQQRTGAVADIRAVSENFRQLMRMTEAQLREELGRHAGNDRLQTLFSSFGMTIPGALAASTATGESDTSPQARLARSMRTLFGLSGSGTPTEAEMASGLDRLIREIDRTTSGLDLGPAGVASAVYADLVALRESLNMPEHQRLAGTLIRRLQENPESFLDLFAQTGRILQEGPAGLEARWARAQLGLPAGATMPTAADIQRRMEQLRDSVVGLDRMVTLSSGGRRVMGSGHHEARTVDLDAGPPGETPRAQLLDQLRRLRESLEAPGANVLQILAASGNRQLMTDMTNLLSRGVPAERPGGEPDRPEGHVGGVDRLAPR